MTPKAPRVSMILNACECRSEIKASIGRPLANQGWDFGLIVEQNVSAMEEKIVAAVALPFSTSTISAQSEGFVRLWLSAVPDYARGCSPPKKPLSHLLDDCPAEPPSEPEAGSPIPRQISRVSSDRAIQAAIRRRVRRQVDEVSGRDAWRALPPSFLECTRRHRAHRCAGCGEWSTGCSCRKLRRSAPRPAAA